jgi:hypothetical protein
MNAPLPNLVERMLGVEPAGAGEGTAWSLEYTWSWAPWLTLLFVIAAVAYVAWIYVHEGGEAGRWLKALLAGVRLSLIFLVLFMIAQVVLSLERTGLPYVVVVVDDSGSMGITDRYDEPRLRAKLQSVVEGELSAITRLDLAKSVLLDERHELLKTIERDYKLKVYFLSDSARQQPDQLDEVLEELEKLEPTGETTQLGRGIRTVLNDLLGSPPAAIVLLSDGVTTDGESLSAVTPYARRKGIPLFTVAIGDEQPPRDVELSDLLVDEVVFVDDIVNFEFQLAASGLEGQPIEILLKQKDVAEPLARLTVDAPATGEPRKLRLPFRPKEVGEFEYVIEAQPLEDEISSENNWQSRVVSVRKEQIRVLLVQSYPNYEFRYLKNMLERDSTIELKTLLQDADPEYVSQDKSAISVFPTRREELYAFDVILFGDVNPEFLSGAALSDLAAFVSEKGGGLVVMAGPAYTPTAFRGSALELLLPVELSSSTEMPPSPITDSYAVSPTELGLASPPLELGDTSEETRRIWADIPGFYWLYPVEGLRPGARVLAEHPTKLMEDGRPMPVFALQYVGAGKVLFHAADETWRWRYRVGDLYFARYWVQTLRYLSRSKLLGKDRLAELAADRREYRRGEAARLRVRFLDDRRAPADEHGVSLVVEHHGRKQVLPMTRNAASRGIFEGVLPQLNEGPYHAWVGTPALEGHPPAVDFLVVAPPGEFASTVVDVRELERAAIDTKGRFYRAADAGRLAGDLPRGRQVPIDSLPPLVLWNQWPLLLLFLALLVTEWMLRKRKGLL